MSQPTEDDNEKEFEERLREIVRENMEKRRQSPVKLSPAPAVDPEAKRLAGMVRDHLSTGQRVVVEGTGAFWCTRTPDGVHQVHARLDPALKQRMKAEG